MAACSLHRKYIAGIQMYRPGVICGSNFDTFGKAIAGRDTEDETTATALFGSVSGHMGASV
jgi:hypothetical protein